jgi:hypothetical protein
MVQMRCSIVLCGVHYISRVRVIAEYCRVRCSREGCGIADGWCGIAE